MDYLILSIIVGIYILGYVSMLGFLITFGKKFGFDKYDSSRIRSYSDYEDYDSNAEAYVSWSFAWPILVPFHIIYFLYTSLVNKIKKYTN
jgi:hypothetical protein